MDSLAKAQLKVVCLWHTRKVVKRHTQEKTSQAPAQTFWLWIAEYVCGGRGHYSSSFDYSEHLFSQKWT